MIKPIETSYKGCRFRSRLEARWAVFFDALRLRWEYEPEGFDLDGMLYLPDFYLPDLPMWVEAKATGQDAREDWELCRRLCVATRTDVMLAFGEFTHLHVAGGEVVGSCRGWAAPGGEFQDGCWEFAQCPQCGLIGAAHCGQHARCSCRCDHATCGLEEAHHAAQRGWLWCATCGLHLRSGSYDRLAESCHQSWKRGDSPALMAAYAAARSARFEHGESPDRRAPPKPSDRDPWPVGSVVRHQDFGVGRVAGYARCDGLDGELRLVVVAFADAGEKLLSVAHSRFEVIRLEPDRD